MVELLKHNFRIVTSHKRSLLLMGLVFPFCFYLLDPGPDFYIHPMLSILVLLIGIAISVTKESTGVLINSLPTEKVAIVKSRFIFMIIATLGISIYLLLVAYLLRNSGHSVYIQNGNNIIAFFNIGFSALAFLMPIGFLSAKGLDAILMIIFFIVMGFSWKVWEMGTKHTLIYGIITMVLLIGSFFMSRSIFNDKEFH